MKVVTTNQFKQALHKFPVESQNLLGWYKVIAHSSFASEQEIKQTFGGIENQNNTFIFPIPRSSVMVHVKVNYDSQVALIMKIKPGQQ
jgi:mRNA-degrading endonuclease HigB of HigAB toxin-antitoxin module